MSINIGDQVKIHYTIRDMYGEVIESSHGHTPMSLKIEKQQFFGTAENLVGLKKGDNIVIVDDVLSTGGTLKAIISSIKKIGVIIKGIYIVVDKGDVAKKIMNESKVKIDTIVNIDVVDGKVVIKNI